ncbi:MAG: RluA family pseudouridine synthase [Clostridia bacterium]
MSQNRWLEYTVTEQDTEMTVEQVIREKMMVSGRMLQRLTRSKGIQLNRKTPFLGRKVKTGDKISVRVADRPEHPEGKGVSGPRTVDAELPKPDILYEDDLFVIVNKPAGMMVHPVNAEQTATLVHALAAYWTGQGETAVPHPVHRLDKETSGAVLIAKSSYAHQLADRLLRENKISREYIAVLTGSLEQEEGTIEVPIARDPFHKVRRRVSKNGGERAVTHYRVLARSADLAKTLVQVWLETGRTHQIRVHFAHLGHPLVGDTLYGGKRHVQLAQALHAHRLSFSHPVSGQVVAVQADAPEAMKTLLQTEFPSA